MIVQFHPEAESEFRKAIDYFEDQQRELGLDLSIEVYNTIQRIKANPESWPKISNNIRRALVRRFPYGLLYHFNSESNQVTIVAVMHLRREPGYWKSRI